jgi:hypothetical protein
MQVEVDLGRMDLVQRVEMVAMEAEAEVPLKQELS